jgi:putative DNA primase/helicase
MPRKPPPADDDDWQPMPIPDGATPEFRHPKLGEPSATWSYIDAAGELQGYVCRFETKMPDGSAGKELRPRRYGTLTKNGSPHTGWYWKGWGENRPLYGLCDLLARPDVPVIVVEGEKKVDAARRLFPDHVAVSPMNGAKSPHRTDWTPLAQRMVVIWPDHDAPGLAFARAVAELATKAAAASIVTVAVPGGWPEGWDLADEPPNGDAPEILTEMLASAKPWVPPGKSSGGDGGQVPPNGHDAEICRLAKLSPSQYERERKSAAERLGYRTSILDKLVLAERSGDGAPGQGRPLDLPEPEIWPDPVDGTALLDELTRAVRRYVVADRHEVDAVVLWSVAAHAYDAFAVFPRLFVTAPEKGCGKSTMLEVVSLIVPRALPASNITAAALFRTIEAAKPTLLLDEADTFAKDNEELRGVLDAGHRRDGAVIRLVGDSHEPRQFSVWAPVALAAIGRLPGTIEDRSIIVRLRRRRPDEEIASLRGGRALELETLARKVARWAADHPEEIASADPEMPAGIYNRAADNWHPLLVFADLAGGEWPERARQAAVELSRGGGDSESARVQLLADLRALFEAASSGVLFTKEILADLVKRDDRPWSEWKNGKPITGRQIAALLKPLGITTNQTVRRGIDHDKGYRRKDMEDAFERYLPASQSVTRGQVADSAAFTDFLSVTRENDVTDTPLENPSIPVACHRVTDREPHSLDEEGIWTA